MDTRSKILTLDQAAAALGSCGVTVVTGYFDGLRAADVRELAALPRPLLAIVLPVQNELLNQRARAEMAAALRVIDYVVIANESDLDALLERLSPRELVRLETAHAAHVHELIEHVRARQIR